MKRGQRCQRRVLLFCNLHDPWYSYGVANSAEADIVQKILARDKRALFFFYQTHTPHLRRFIRGKITNRDDAEEILQDTLFAFLEALRDFHGNASIKSFLYSICQHKIVDFYRRKKLRHVVFSQVPQLEALISPLMSTEETIDTAFLKEKIAWVIGRLLPQYRRVIILKYLDNLSAAEIAKKLTVTIKSAESTLFRARRAFVKAFVSI